MCRVLRKYEPVDEPTSNGDRSLHRVAGASLVVQARPAQFRELRERAQKELGDKLTFAASTMRC